MDQIIINYSIVAEFAVQNGTYDTTRPELWNSQIWLPYLLDHRQKYAKRTAMYTASSFHFKLTRNVHKFIY